MLTRWEGSCWEMCRLFIELCQLFITMGVDWVLVPCRMRFLSCLTRMGEWIWYRVWLFCNVYWANPYFALPTFIVSRLPSVSCQYIHDNTLPAGNTCIVIIDITTYISCRSPVYSHGVHGWRGSTKVSEKRQRCSKTFWQQRDQPSRSGKVGCIESDSTRTGVPGCQKCIENVYL